jgi:hypothetical protein
MYTAPDFLQLSHQTRAERFPRIFDTVRQLKPDARRILSFGCSTGEECMSLAERFPAAEVVGVEIDQYTVRTARANNRHPGRVFFLDQVGGTGQYDLCRADGVLVDLHPHHLGRRKPFGQGHTLLPGRTPEGQNPAGVRLQLPDGVEDAGEPFRPGLMRQLKEVGGGVHRSILDQNG